MVRSAFARLWTALTNPTVRLQVNFPWSTGKMAKIYSVALACYLFGTFVPLILIIGALKLVAAYRPEWLTFFSSDHDVVVFFAYLTVLTFLTGFGAELWYLRRAMKKDGLSLRKTVGLNLDSLGGSLWAAISRALVAFGIVQAIGLAYGYLPLPTVHDPAAEFAQQLVGGSFWAMAVLMVFAAPFFEELIFRGFLFNMLRDAFHRGRPARFLSSGVADFLACFISAAAFSAAHMNLPGFVLYLAIGMVSAELYRRSGSLVPSIFLHAMNNLLGVIVLWQSLAR